MYLSKREMCLIKEKKKNFDRTLKAWHKKTTDVIIRILNEAVIRHKTYMFLLCLKCFISDCKAAKIFVFLAADDAESPAGGRRSGPSGKCKPHGGHLLKVPATESRLPWHHKPEGSVRNISLGKINSHFVSWVKTKRLSCHFVTDWRTLWETLLAWQLVMS